MNARELLHEQLKVSKTNKIEFKRVNYSNVFNGDTEGTAIALGAVSADSQLNRGGCVYTHTWHVDKFTRKKYT